MISLELSMIQQKEADRQMIREAMAEYTGARRFDGGIQGQQIGLRGNGPDQPGHIIDPDRCGVQPINQRCHAIRLIRRAAGGLRDRIDPR